MLIIIACMSMLCAGTGITLMFYNSFIPVPFVLITAGIAILLSFVIIKKIKGVSSPKMSRIQLPNKTTSIKNRPTESYPEFKKMIKQSKKRMERLSTKSGSPWSTIMSLLL